MLSRLVLAQGKAPQSGSTSTSHISSIKRSNAHKRIPLAPKRLFGTKSTPKTPGMVSLEDLKALAQTRQIDTVAMSFTDHLGRQMGKRCDADFFLEEGVSGSYACNYLLTVDMDSNVLPGFKFSNWEAGYGDFKLVPDLSTMRIASWLDRTVHVTCDVVDPKKKELVGLAPRSVLRRQLAQLKREPLTANFTPLGASELEYFLYNDSFETAHKKGYQGLESVGYYPADYHMLQSGREEKLNAAMRRHLKDSGIPVESSKGEYGRGQYELNIRYADVLTMGDRHMVYKQAFKDVASQSGLSVTFMAKPHSDQSGSSCHLHVNLADEHGVNAFAGTEDFHGIKCSPTFRHFLGGWLACAPELMAFYAPTINSYKRIVNSPWASQPLSWNPENRSAAFRVVGEGQSLRIECRLPGADINPYLAFAAAVASGAHGIVNKIEPTTAATLVSENDNLLSDDPQQRLYLPTSLAEAAQQLRNSNFARASFGDDVVDHYAHLFESECRSFDRAVTNWERARYFEQA